MGWDYPQDRIRKFSIRSEDGRVATIHGGKEISNWRKSDTYPDLWEADCNETGFDQLFVGGRRAINARSPNDWDFATLVGYDLQDDPNNESNYIRYFYVQKDCIELLSKLSKAELQASEIVVAHAWYVTQNYIHDIDANLNAIITIAPKNGETRYPEMGCLGANNLYFIQNAIRSVTQPGEYCIYPGGKLYYYPYSDDDINNPQAFIPVTPTLFDFNNCPNVTFSRIHFEYCTNAAIGGLLFNNLLVEDCNFTHLSRAFYFQGTNNSRVEHCLIEDTSGNGAGFGTCNNFTVNNCIIRKIGQIPPYGFGIDFWAENQDIYITNNDISDGTTSLLFFGNNVEYNNPERSLRYTIENNNLHHAGFALRDDVAGIFFGRFPPSVLINHNSIHDIAAAHYSGNGISPDTGSTGSVTTNNLIYNISHQAWGMNYGKEHHVKNNILALSGAGIGFSS